MDSCSPRVGSIRATIHTRPKRTVRRLGPPGAVRLSVQTQTRKKQMLFKWKQTTKQYSSLAPPSGKKELTATALIELSYFQAKVHLWVILHQYYSFKLVKNYIFVKQKVLLKKKSKKKLITSSKYKKIHCLISICEETPKNCKTKMSIA